METFKYYPYIIICCERGLSQKREFEEVFKEITDALKDIEISGDYSYVIVVDSKDIRVYERKYDSEEPQAGKYDRERWL